MQDRFRGNIGTGTIQAKFFSDFSNIDPDSLVATYAADDGSGAQAPHDEASPGGSAKVEIKAAKPGLLEVLVRTGHDEESGRLQVSRNGVIVHDEAIQGPARWFYVVVTS
jgi:hypothetical protein